MVVGTSWVGDTLDFAVARLKKNGRLDTSFDHDGKQIIDFGMDQDYANDVALQRDGKIVVVGRAGDGEGSIHFALARLMGKGSKNSPTISINDIEGLEGNSGTTPFTFTVRLSHRSRETVTVKYQTVNRYFGVPVRERHADLRPRRDDQDGDRAGLWRPRGEVRTRRIVRRPAFPADQRGHRR